jgi:hypothetical protein
MARGSHGVLRKKFVSPATFQNWTCQSFSKDSINYTESRTASAVSSANRFVRALRKVPLRHFLKIQQLSCASV